ncbi:MAG: glutathione S-transferase [Sphingomonadales bacterium]
MSLKLLIANKNYSSWSIRPLLVLEHFGIRYELVYGRVKSVAVANEIATEIITDWSGAGRVPVLRDGGLTIWESIAIIEYLADRYPDKPIWPADPATRALARAVSAEMHAGFSSLRNEMPMNARRRYDGFSYGPETAADIARIRQLWADCLARSGGPFLCGDFCAADAMFAPVISRFRTYGVKLDAVSETYADTAWALPAVKAWLADAAAEPMVIEKYEL